VSGGGRRTELGPTRLRPISWGRVGYRLLGLAATLGLVALVYWLLPEYHGSFYHPYWVLLYALAPAFALAPLYFAWTDTRLRTERDEYWQLGRLLCGHWRDAESATLRRHFLGWTVKAFFLPLMAVYLNDDYAVLTRFIRGADPAALWNYNAWFTLSYTIDLLFCVIGYVISLRLFDSHMRSVEPTMTGWVAALICYQPFYSVIGQAYLRYEGSVFWDNWLAPWPLVQDGWGIAIIVLSLIYALSTVAFGLRFSNLTHRGIITNGPYRFSKHPAYLSKNLSWWLISVPFMQSWKGLDAFRHCALLLLVNAVYFLRARTEERHLSKDPVYVAYASWINDHGLLSRLGRVMPWLRYRPPV
jgi:protein-S-isoprenylcysteine O-methyltransferase Ste14